MDLSSKKILFITHNKENLSDGVWKKIVSQVSALRDMGAYVDFIYFDAEMNISIDNGTSGTIILPPPLHKFLFYRVVSKNLNVDYDIVYARKPHGGLYSVFFSCFVNRIKECKSCSLVLEIPTYPYAREIKNFKDRISELFFSLCKRKFIKDVDLITYMGGEVSKIWGVNAVKIANGISLQGNPLINEKKTCDKFIFTGVANLAFWHGYDRLILSVLNYEGDREIYLNIVGGVNDEYNRLSSICKDHVNSNRVIFKGQLQGEELDKVFNVTDVCVDSLGRHRSGNNENSSIKSKEFTAKGLPFIKSHIDSSFFNVDFVYDVSPDDSLIDIDEVIEWRNNLPNGFSIKERNYASSNLTWEKQFCKVLSEI